LENTFAQTFCRAGNLKAYITHTSSDIIGGLKRSFATMFEEGGKHAEFNNILGDTYEDTESWLPKTMRSPPSKLDAVTHQSFVDFLNRSHPEKKYVIKENAYGKITVTPLIWSLDKARHSGFWYRSVYPRKVPLTPNDTFSPHPDSHILVKTSEDRELVPASIQEIFFHKHGREQSMTSMQGVFIIFRRYLPLEHEDIEKDHWKRYPVGGGRVYYDQLASNYEFARIGQIVSHFAKTPLTSNDISGLTKQCIHVLPLNWVRNLYSTSISTPSDKT
jgi:hypothetical protein